MQSARAVEYKIRLMSSRLGYVNDLYSLVEKRGELVYRGKILALVYGFRGWVVGGACSGECF